MALILDVLGVAQRANVVSGVRERALAEKSAGVIDAAGERQTVLLFATRQGGRMAIPLSLVSRLEEFPRSAVERVGPQQVIQYRNEILPLVPVSRLLRQARRDPGNDTKGNGGGQRSHLASPAPHASENGNIQVVVLASKGQRLGLVVDQILDIAQETIVSRSPAHRPGVLFTAVIQGRATEFLDVERMLASVAPELLENAGERILGVPAARTASRLSSLVPTS